jgi:hypothetical protein
LVRKGGKEGGRRKEWIREVERFFLSTAMGVSGGDDLHIGETESKVS